MKVPHVKTVRYFSLPSNYFWKHRLTLNTGGELGHRKYDCSEKKNVSTSIICRACGNSGHLARDCRDRAKESDWRASSKANTGDTGKEGDHVDREYEVRVPLLYQAVTSNTT